MPKSNYSSILQALSTFNRMLNWAVNNPLQALVAMLAIQIVIASSRNDIKEAKDIHPEGKDITDGFDINDLELETNDISHLFDVQDVSEAYRSRHLQSTQTCESSIVFPDTGNSWALTLGASNSDLGNAIAVGFDGSIVLTGSTSNFGAVSSDILVAQFDSYGTLSWAKTLGATNYDRGNSLALRSDGSIVLTGYTASFGAGSDDVLVAQLNEAGDAQFNSSLIQPFTGIQTQSLNPIVNTITSIVNNPFLAISAQNWTSVQNSIINPLIQNYLGYLQGSLKPIQNQIFNQLYSLNLTTLLNVNTALLRLNALKQPFLPAWLQYNSVSKVLSGTPTGTVRGYYYINMNLQEYGQQQEITFIINVTNTAPYYIGNSTLNTATGRFVFPLSTAFRDNEADPIYPFGLGLLNGQLPPTIASIDTNSGRLFGTALSGDQGTYQFNVTASDPYNGIGWKVISVNVNNANPRAAILFTNPAPVTVGNAFSFNFASNAFVDPDGDAITYSAVYPSFLNYDSSSRTLYGTLQAQNRGKYNFTITASDPYGGQGNVTLLLDVNGIPAQQIALSSLMTTPVGVPYSYPLPNGLFTDPDGDAISY